MMQMQTLAASNALQILLPLMGSILLSYGVYQIIVETRKGERKRVMDRLRGNKKIVAAKAESTSILKEDKLTADVGSIIHATFGKLAFIPKLQIWLEQAALPWSAPNMVANLFAAAAILFAGLYLLNINVLAAFCASACVMGLPFAYVFMRRQRRIRKLIYQLPDVFEMMSQALRAGHSLPSAIHLIHEQMPDPVSTEFGRVFHEQNLGIKMEDALTAMADRVDALDVRMFVTAVLIQRTTGGDLAEILDKIGSVIRGRIELAGIVKGLTAEGRLSGWVLFGLPIFVFFACMKMNYEYVSILWTHPWGKIMMVAASGMMLMGLAMIRWIVNIKV